MDGVRNTPADGATPGGDPAIGDEEVARARHTSAVLDSVKLTPLMERTIGRAEIRIALIDGPVAIDHPDLASQNIRAIAGSPWTTCTRTSSIACLHGTFVAGILCARRGSLAPAICPGCTLLVRPVFSELTNNGRIPRTAPSELALAIVQSVEAGARVINLSAALGAPSPNSERELEDALHYAAYHGTIIVAAGGNQGTLGSSAITRHPWVIPVIGSDRQSAPMPESNLGTSIGRRGLRAPGNNITSIGADGNPRTFDGTSVATPFVTGAIALLWSEFPAASPTEVKYALVQPNTPNRASVVPPLLDAWSAFLTLAAGRTKRLERPIQSRQ